MLDALRPPAPTAPKTTTTATPTKPLRMPNEYLILYQRYTMYLHKGEMGTLEALFLLCLYASHVGEHAAAVEAAAWVLGPQQVPPVVVEALVVCGYAWPMHVDEGFEVEKAHDKGVLEVYYAIAAALEQGAGGAAVGNEGVVQRGAGGAAVGNEGVVQRGVAAAWVLAANGLKEMIPPSTLGKVLCVVVSVCVVVCVCVVVGALGICVSAYVCRGLCGCLCGGLCFQDACLFTRASSI